MLITCKSCAAVNFIQSNRVKNGEAHCTICRKLIDTTTPPDEDQRGFRISHNPSTADTEDATHGELEKKIESMNAMQRLAICARYEEDSDSMAIEDEEEEELDMTPSLNLPQMELARWNAATVSIPAAAKARLKLNQRLTVAAWLFVVGLGTAGVAGAAVSHATPSTDAKDKNATKPAAPPTAAAMLSNLAVSTPRKATTR